MSRDNNGNYTLPAGNPVVSGEVISTLWANPTLDDIAASLTDSLSRTGQGGMLSPFKNADGTLANPGITWSNEPTSGFYRAALQDMRASIGGVDKMRWISGGSQLWNGAAWSNILTALTLAPILTPYAIKAADEDISGAWTFSNTAASFSPIFEGYPRFNQGAQVDYYLELAVPVGGAVDNGQILFYDYGAALNEKAWLIQQDRSQKNFVIASLNDLSTGQRNYLEFIRGVGQAVTAINYGNSTDKPPHTFYGNIIQPTFVGVQNSLSLTKFPDGLNVGYVELDSATGNPGASWNAASAPANERWWNSYANIDGTFYLASTNDAFTIERNVFKAGRNGVAISDIEYGNIPDYPKHIFHGLIENHIGTFPAFSCGGDPVTSTDSTFAKLLSTDYCEVIAHTFGAAVYGPGMGVLKSHGTLAAPTKVLAGDALGQFYFGGTLADLTTGFPCLMQYDVTADATTSINGYWHIRMGINDADYKSRLKVAFDGTIDLASLAFPATVRTNGIEVGYRQIPRIASGAATATAAVNGKCYSATGTITVPSAVFAAGDSFSIYNNTAANLSVLQGAGLTLRLVGTATTGTRTMAQRAIATVWFESATEAVITGGGLT